MTNFKKTNSGNTKYSQYVEGTLAEYLKDAKHRFGSRLTLEHSSNPDAITLVVTRTMGRGIYAEARLSVKQNSENKIKINGVSKIPLLNLLVFLYFPLITFFLVLVFRTIFLINFLLTIGFVMSIGMVLLLFWNRRKLTYEVLNASSN